MFPLKGTLTTVSSGNNYTQPSPGALNLPRTVCWHMGYGFFHNTHLIYFDVFFHTECKVFFFLLLPVLLADSCCENIFLSRARDVSFINAHAFQLLAPESLISSFWHGLLCDEAKMYAVCAVVYSRSCVVLWRWHRSGHFARRSSNNNDTWSEMSFLRFD